MKLLLLLLLVGLVCSDPGQRCQGKGRSSCSLGEFCREDRCVRVRLKKPGCRVDSDCADDWKCSSGVCIRFLTEDERKKLKIAAKEADRHLEL